MKTEFDLKTNKAVYYKGSAEFDRYLTKKYLNPTLEDDERELEKLAEKAWDGGYEDEISAELGYYVLIESDGYGYDKANQYLAEMIENGWITLEDVA